MADESPEQIRERVHSEELAKGSDPRVAEGRAKAAELRAKAGLPIEPDKAWRAKLEKEGGEAPAESPAASAAEPAEEATPKEEEEPAPAATEEAPEPSAAAEAPAAAAAAAPSPAAAPAPAAGPAAEAPPAVGREPEFVLASAAPRELEVGQPIEVETEGLKVVAGVPVRNDPLPFWVTGILLVVVLWAVAYALFLSGPEAISKTSRCRVGADKTLVCATRPTPSP